jgi:hypothetical protein
MAVTAHVFPQFQLGLASKLQNLSSDSIMCALSNTAGPVGLATSGVQAAKLWTDWKTNVAAEISGTGYTAGGQLLTGVSSTVTGNVWTLTATSPAWTSSTITANQAIFYDSTASTEQLIAFWDFGGAVSDTSGTYTLTINASGIVTATVV